MRRKANGFPNYPIRLQQERKGPNANSDEDSYTNRNTDSNTNHDADCDTDNNADSYTDNNTDDYADGNADHDGQDQAQLSLIPVSEQSPTACLRMEDVRGRQ